MPKTPTPKPLEISYFLTGFYTYRSQLFAPFRAIGVNIVTYHDPVIDGADFELTDLFEWQQRPGFTQFCSEQLASGEIINQFYSARALNGTLLTMFDSNQRLATFSSTAINTVYTKNTPNQGYVNQVGDTTYFYDGVDAIHNDQIYGLGPNGIAAPSNAVTVTSTGGWLANTGYPAGAVLLDYNGNIQYAASSTSAGTSLLQDNQSLNVTYNNTWWEVAAISPNQWRTTGYATTTPGTPMGAWYVTGFGFDVPTNAVILGVQVSLGLISQSPTTATVNGVSLFYEGTTLGTTLDPSTPFYTTATTNVYGISTDNWGATLTPAIVNDPSFGFGISTTLASIRVFLDYPLEMRVFYFIPAGSSGTSGVTGSRLPTWAVQPGTFTTDGSMRWNNLGSMGVWEPGVAYTIPSVILDSNNNLQTVSLLTAVEAYDNSTTYNSGDAVLYAGQYWTAQGTFSGIVPNSGLASSTVSGSTVTYKYNWIQTPNPQTSGGTVPTWATAIGGETSDGSLLWTNIGPGNILVNAGYSYGICYRTLDGHLSTMSDPPTTNTGPLLGGSPLQTSDVTSFGISSNVLTVVAEQTFTPSELVYIQGMTTGTYLNNQVFKVISAVPSSSYPITNVSLTSNVVTFTSVNSLTFGTQITLQGMVSATFLNGQTLTVLSTGLSGTQFECNFTHANYSSTPDSGTGIVVSLFTAAFVHADVASTPDVGIVSPVIAQLSGDGTDDPRLQYSTTVTNVSLTGNIVTLDCDNIFFPGTTIVVAGLSGANFLNGFPLLLDTATPTQVTSYFNNPDYASATDNGTASLAGVEIYRTADGGGVWYLCGVGTQPPGSATSTPSAIASEGAGIPWESPSYAVGSGTIGSTSTATIISFSITSNVVTFASYNSFVTGQTVAVSGMTAGTYLNTQTLTVLSSGLSSSGFEANFTHGDVGSTLDAGFATPTTEYAYGIYAPAYTPPGGYYTAYAYPGIGTGESFSVGAGLFAAYSGYADSSGAGGINGYPFSPSATYTSLAVQAPTLPAGAVIHSIVPFAVATQYASKTGSIYSFKVISTSLSYDAAFGVTGSPETLTSLGTVFPTDLVFQTYAYSSLEVSPGSSIPYGFTASTYGVAVNYSFPSGGTPTPADQLQTLVTGSYGLAIPDGNVTGVQVVFTAGTTAASPPVAAAELYVQLTLNGIPVGATQLISSVGTWPTGYALGGPGYLWGLSSLTAAQANGNDGLGVNITGTLNGSEINLNGLAAKAFYIPKGWVFTDIYPDSDLNQQLVAPIAHLNDPPPGQTGSIAAPFKAGSLCAFWQGRQWLAQGQYLYFDGGEDVLNGDPHQSWPPGNRFEYPGTIMGIAALDKGLVVLGADYFGLALGGPQTLTFYPLVILKNFGISSPNCLYQDGQTLHMLTTQGQLFETTTESKTNEGHYISDFISANFPPASSYVTVHRNGEDAGLFLGNGSTTLLRSGINIGGAWSVPYYPIGGVGALQSIETSIGTYSLCAAPTTAAGYIMARNLKAWSDMGGQYTSTFASDGCGITLGSITLSGPGEPLPPVQHIVVYADAAGVDGAVDQPVVAILPNEISAINSLGFVTIPPDQVVPEPPPPAALVSTSLQQLRYPINMVNSQITQYMHHLQVRILYPSTDAPHTVKALAIKFDQD